MSRKNRKNVGLIGLGIIGSRVAAGLRATGHQVFVWNRTPKPAPNFLGSAAEVAAICDVIQLFVADSSALFEVIDSIRDTLTANHVIVCCATVGPEATLEAARLVEEKGAKFLDAPFTGSKVAAENRQLVYYIGGEEAAFLRVKSVLEATSKAIVRIGAVGHAAVIKVVTNMIAAVSVQTLAEALAIVKKSGLNPEVLSAALEHNACRSATMDLKLPKMISGDYEPHFSLKHMFKDVQLGIHIANTLDIEVPATTITASVMYGAFDQGWADLDFSALFKVYEKQLAPPAPATIQQPAVYQLDTTAAPAKPAEIVTPVPAPAAKSVELKPDPQPAPMPPSPAGEPPAAGAKPAENSELPIATEKLPDAPADAQKIDSEKTAVAAEVATGEDGAAFGHPVNFVKRWFVSRPGG